MHAVSYIGLHNLIWNHPPLVVSFFIFVFYAWAQKHWSTSIFASPVCKGISQQEINRKTGVDRKTIRKYGRLDGLVAGQGAFASKSPSAQEVATGADVEFSQNPPPRPPARQSKPPKHARSACEPHREWIKAQIRLGRNGMAIYQDLVECFGFMRKRSGILVAAPSM